MEEKLYRFYISTIDNPQQRVYEIAKKYFAAFTIFDGAGYHPGNLPSPLLPTYVIEVMGLQSRFSEPFNDYYNRLIAKDLNLETVEWICQTVKRGC